MSKLETTTSNYNVACGKNFADFAPGYTVGPHGQTIDSLMSTGAQYNAGFSEQAWAEARQNGNAAPSIENRLPSWPPSDAHGGFGHTYPVQSKRDETVLGSSDLRWTESMAIGPGCKESGTLPPLFINPSKATTIENKGDLFVFDKNLRESYDLWDKYSATNVPRVNGTLAAREYDMALDIADKISRGSTLTSTFYTMPGRDGGCGEPVSYAQKDDMTAYSSSISPTDAFGQKKSARGPVRTNKRLTNLLVPDREYGAAVRKGTTVGGDVPSGNRVIMKVTSSVDQSETGDTLKKKKKSDKNKTERKRSRSDDIACSALGIIDQISNALSEFSNDAIQLPSVLVKYDGCVSKTTEHMMTHNGRGTGLAYAAALILIAVFLIVAIIYAMKK